MISRHLELISLSISQIADSNRKLTDFVCPILSQKKQLWDMPERRESFTWRSAQVISSRNLKIFTVRPEKPWTLEIFQECLLCYDQSQQRSGYASKPQNHKLRACLHEGGGIPGVWGNPLRWGKKITFLFTQSYNPAIPGCTFSTLLNGC